MDLPLKADFFPQVRLTVDERSKYARIVDASVTALRRSLDARDWAKLYDKDGVAFSKMHCIDDQQSRTAAAPTGATACLAVCATIFTPGTISEVLEAIASPVTEDYRKAMAFVYRERFLDAVALHTLAPSAPQAFTTIKWAAFDDGKAHNSAKFPLGSDYCYLEHSGIRTTESGDAFGFSLQESIVREREVPSLAGFGLRRGEFHRTGIVVLPTERRDVVQVSSILQMRLLGSDSAANKAALERLMLKRVAAVGRIDVLLERRRLSKMQFVHRDEWVADEDRKACAVCVKPFSIRRRHHCRNCGEVVCSTCAPPREVDVSNFGSALIRICTACVVQARSEPQQAVHTPSNNNAADVFVYHVRSSFSSSDASDDAIATAPRDTTRPRALSSDSNFSIASEYPQPPLPLYHQHHYQHQSQSQPHHYGHLFQHQQLMYQRDAPDDAEAYYARASQASSEDSSYSFSDLNTFDDRFGSVALKRLAPQSLPSSSHVRPSRHQLFHEPQAPPERAAYTPSKVVTHLLTRSVSDQSGQDDDAVNGELSRSFLSTGSLNEDFDACIRGLQDDISRATTTRVSDLAPGESFCSDVTSFLCEDRLPVTTTTAIAGGISDGLSLHSASAAPRVSASSSSPSTVDADIELLLLHDDFSLLCPDTLQRQQQRASSIASVHQDAGEQQQRRGSGSPVPVSAPAPAPTPVMVQSPAPATGRLPTPPPSASIVNEEANDHADDTTVRLASHADLLALRRQVEGLHKSLEDATSKLQYYQSRAVQGPRTQRTASTESDASTSSTTPASAPVAPLPVDASRRTRRRGSRTTTATSKDTQVAAAPASASRRAVGRQDPALAKRTETYDALVSELHELMGLPTLSPRAAPCS